MEPLSATWGFVRPSKTDVMRCCPLAVDALHALQRWRVGHAGRTFRFVRSSPFSSVERLSARLLHLGHDALADDELAHWCHEHNVQALAETSTVRENGTC